MPLAEFAGVTPAHGHQDGLQRGVPDRHADARCPRRRGSGVCRIIRPYLRGQDINRWHAEWAALWMIALKSSRTIRWPWPTLGKMPNATFAATYPSIYDHSKGSKAASEPGRTKGVLLVGAPLVHVLAGVRATEDRVPGNPVPPLLRGGRDGTLANNKVFFIAFVRPLPPDRPELSAPLVAQLVLPAAHEGRGTRARQRISWSTCPSPSRPTSFGPRSISQPVVLSPSSESTRTRGVSSSTGSGPSTR